jgi:drug/metabolite transporter (DMT)-like permease
MSVFSIVLPFSLITWAELEVSSSLAAILTGTVPLFVIGIAAVLLRDEPISVNRVAGLVVGFAGVIVITVGGSSALTGSEPAQLALLVAAASYAFGGVYARRFVSGLRPMVPALFQVGFAFVISVGLAVGFERPFELRYTEQAIVAVVWLGLLGSGLAYLAFFRLLKVWGATRTSLVAYLLPVVGIILGAGVASEAIDLRMIVGTALVIGGIALVNARHGQRRLFARAPAPRGEPAR